MSPLGMDMAVLLDGAVLGVHLAREGTFACPPA